MKRLVILNPTARRASRYLGLVEDMAAGQDAELQETEGAGDASELARRARAEGVSEIVSAGGDGTLNEIVNGLAPFGADEGSGGERLPRVPAVGLLPLGTGNDTARSLGVPLDPEEARARLEEDTVRSVDVGRVSGGDERYFVNSAIGGVGGLVERRLSGRLKRWLGSYSYRAAAISALRHVPRYRVTVDWAGGHESIRAVAYSVVVANGSSAGGGVPVAPGARMDDGRLEVVVIESGPLRRIPGLVLDVLRGRHLQRDDVRRITASAVTLRSRPAMWVSVDGEVFGDQSLRVEILRGALRVLAPRADGDAAASSDETQREV